MPLYDVTFKTTRRETIQIEAKDYDEAFDLSHNITPKHYEGDDSDAEIDYEADVTLVARAGNGVNLDDPIAVASILDFKE